VGSIVEQARGLITEKKSEGKAERLLKRVLLSGVLAHPRRLSMLMALLRVYERSGLRSLVRVLLARVAPGLAERERLMPSVGRKPEPLPAIASPIGDKRSRVALFTGCIASHCFSDVNEATVRVLQRNGFEVVVPKDQVCCGALHQHNGLPDTGRSLARETSRSSNGAGSITWW
jgi:glycolate oxidase iron-sulfur subunit